MRVRLHSHAQVRLQERGSTEHEVSETVIGGERFEGKYGRTGFRRNFPFDGHWQGKYYLNKQLEVYAVQEAGEWLVITVIAKYF